MSDIIIPKEIARFKSGVLGCSIEWFNPFNNYAEFKFFNYKGDLINKHFVEPNGIFEINNIEKYLTKSYNVEVTNITNNKVELYSVVNNIINK